MASGTGVRDFTDYANQPWPGKAIPLVFNNIADAGDGYPGVQWAMRVWTKDYLHSGAMETGLDMNSQAIWAGDITGTLDYISGFEMISANTGQFAHLTGFSPIQLGTNLDFQGTYHLQDVSEITGAIISGLQVTGTSGTYDDVILTNAAITNAAITNATQNIDFGSSYKLTNLDAPADDNDSARKTDVTDFLPVGTILMFKGTFTNNVTIVGWYKCDGGNGTPNLVDKFIRSEATSDNTGGDDDAVVVSHSHGAGNKTETQDTSHWHNMTIYDKSGTSAIKAEGTDSVSQLGAELTSVQLSDHKHTIASAGVSGTDKNIPAYYSLVFIMRVS